MFSNCLPRKNIYLTLKEITDCLHSKSSNSAMHLADFIASKEKEMVEQPTNYCLTHALYTDHVVIEN